MVVTARTAGEIEAVAGGLRAQGAAAAHAVVCDVTDPESIAALAARAREHLEGGHPGEQRRNRGVGALQRVTLEQWESVHRVNATGPLLATQAFLPGMVERGWGRIVNVASIASHVGARYITAYAASKHALIGMTRCWPTSWAGRA